MKIKTILAFLVLFISGCGELSLDKITIINQDTVIELNRHTQELTYNHILDFKVNHSVSRVFYSKKYSSVFFVANSENHTEYKSYEVELPEDDQGVYRLNIDVEDRSYQAHLWKTEIVLTVWFLDGSRYHKKLR